MLGASRAELLRLGALVADAILLALVAGLKHAGISMTDQMGQTTLYGYDDQGQLTSVTAQLSNVTQYAYDLDGNLTAVTDANGHTTTYEYDLRKQKTKRTLP